jgi:hypothetical protein
MHTVAGVFPSDLDVARALGLLRAGGFRETDLNVLSPRQAAPRPVATDTGEQPGVGRVIGGIVSGAAGTAGGMQLVAAGATGFIPGAGPVPAVGLLAGLVAGVGGAAAGHVIEPALTQGLPKDELHVYEAALRRGHSVVIVLADGDARARRARDLLRDAGAQSIDAARDQWWVGRGDAEAIAYADGGPPLFARDEAIYRRGFEMALHLRGEAFGDAAEDCRGLDPGLVDEVAYRQGFEHGVAYYHRTLAADNR